MIEFHAFIHGYVIQHVACIRSCTYLCNMIFKHAFSLSHSLCICTYSYHGHIAHIFALSNMLHTFIHAHYCDMNIKRVAHICIHAYVCIVASSNQFYAFTHAHMSLHCTKRAAHYRTHICPCIVTTSNEFHAFAHHHMAIPLVQPQ